MRTLDPIALKEGKVRANRRVQASMKLERATNALLWFHDTATEGEGQGPRTVLASALVGENGFGGRNLPDMIVATATAYVEDAAPYVGQAYKEMREAILTRAIELAQMDLAVCEEELR